MNTIDFLDKLDLQAEQRLILQDIGWQEYLAIDSVLEEVPGLLKQWRVSGDRPQPIFPRTRSRIPRQLRAAR
jgi:hypothetical protein